MFKVLFLMLFSFLVSSQIQAADLQTPLEESNWASLSSYDQMMGYLKPLVDSSSRVKMKSIGTSVMGKSIPALYFSQDTSFANQREKKPVVLIICQQHGNEPSSKEAALIVARRLLNQDAGLLKNLNLILVPQVNPDGSDAGEHGVLCGPGPSYPEFPGI